MADVGGRRTVFVGAGEHVYALDAATGAERWRFAAGTGCRDAGGQPPGLCGFRGERNQVESTPLVVGDTVYFGMDVNDVPTGKGGFYAVDASAGTLVWFFDLESGSVCRPDPGDDIRRYDGYHTEAQLGLPAGFLATRSGCGHDRTTTGCGNVWSSAAHDPQRDLLYFGTSNCDTDTDPATPVPPPPMPRYDEALVALRTDGTPAWSWRPREVDNDDLAFGAAPNLFTIDVDGTPTEVVGIGGKDGTYYVLDRDGVNEGTGVGWNDADPSGTAVLVDQGRPRRRHRRRHRHRVGRRGGPPGVLLHRAGRRRRGARSGRPSTRSTSTPARWSGRTPRPRASQPATRATGPRAACPAS